jgi:hypothetical protein
MNVIVAIDVPEPRNEMLFVGKAPQGAECHHWPEPQSMTPVGYWPSKGTSSPGGSSNVST